MVNMKRIDHGALLGGIALLCTAHPVFASCGYATRDLNPVLQPIYLPTHASFSDRDGWQDDHSLYITNTSQEESSGDESLLIDMARAAAYTTWTVASGQADADLTGRRAGPPTDLVLPPSSPDACAHDHGPPTW